MRKIYLLWCFIPMFIGCASSFPITRIEAPKPTPIQTALVQITPGLECFLVEDVPVKTWIDENQNGSWDASEKPLAKVSLYMQAMNPTTVVYADHVTTDINGKGEFRDVAFVSPECSANIAIVPLIPEGFKITTAPQLKIRGEREYLFGFVKAK